MITLVPCDTKKKIKEFEKLPEAIYSDDPYYVPPFPGTTAKFFGPKSPFHGDLYPFLAYKDGKPVGRIAAAINHIHNDHYKDKIGFFGFFDCIDDKEVAKKLYDKAVETVRDKGMDTIRGPYNPSINDECGLLVDGFEASPFIMMTYNPPYLIDLYESLGLKQARDLYAFYISASVAAPKRVERIVNRVKKSTGISVRPVNMKKLKSELGMIAGLYNKTLCRNWGYVPITKEDMESTAAELKEIVDPDMLMIAEKNGKPVGFSLCLPNINEFMFEAKKSKNTLARILRFVWLLKTRKPKEARLAVLGVDPEYRNTGIAALFYYESLMRGKERVIGGELSWVEETNQELIKSLKVMGAEKYKTYRIFESSTIH